MKNLSVVGLVVMVGVSSSAGPFSGDVSLRRFQVVEGVLPGKMNPVAPANVNSCVHALCGSTSENRMMTNLHPGFLIESVTFKKKYDQLQLEARKAYDLEIQADQMTNQILDAALKNFVPLAKSTAEEKLKVVGHLVPKMIFLTHTMKNLQEVEAFYMQGEDGRQVPNEEALEAVYTDEKELAYMSAVVEKILIPMVEMAQAVDIMDRVLRRHDGLLKARLDFKHPNDAAPLRTDARQLLEIVSRVDRELGTIGRIVITSPNRDLLRMASNGTELTVPEMGEYLSVASFVEIMDGVMHLPMPDIEKAATVLDELLGSLHVTRSITQKPWVGFDDVNGFCRLRLNLMEATDQSQLRLRRFDSLIPRVKASALKVASKYVESEDLQALESFLSGIDVHLPRGSRLSTPGFSRNLRNVIDAEQTSVNYFATEEAKTMLPWLKVVEHVMGADESRFSVRVPRFADFCVNLPVEPTTDMSNPGTGRISLSWFSVNYPEVGVGILAHEIGHVVSAFARSLGKEHGAFAESLNCVAKRNPFTVPGTKLSVRDNTTWSEEDWADVFAAEVVKDLNLNQKADLRSSNYACALVHADENGYGLNQLSPVDGDPHSSPLLRLLLQHVDQGGKMPAACEPVTQRLPFGNLQCTAR